MKIAALFLAVLGLAPQDAVFRARTDAVVVSVAVRARNRPVAGLKAADFTLLDNGVPQEITSTNAESVPVDITLVLDTSASLSGAAFEKLKADIHSMAALARPADRVRLMTFASRVVDVVGLRPGTSTLPLDRLSTGGATSFHNALGAALMMSPGADRPQLVFSVTDGFDNASYVNPREVVELARYSSAALYVTLLPSRIFTVSGGQGGFRMGALQGNRFGPEMSASGPTRIQVEAPHQEALREAVGITGGSLYSADANETLPNLFRRVLEDFRTNYVLQYSPRGVTRGGWHEITVAVAGRRDVTVRARKGYEGS